MESLAQLEALCERLYNSQDSAERAHAENTLKCFSTNADYISQCQYILDNASTPYALMLASSSLLKQVTEQRLPLQLRLDIRNYLMNYLATRGPDLEPFVIGSLIQLFCRVIKFGWLDDDSFREVVKESMNFLNQSTFHFAIGLKILNQLIGEMNQPNPGLSSTHHRRVACSFRDQSLLQIFRISLTSLCQLKNDVGSKLQQLALSLSLKCLSFDFVGTSFDESSDDFGSIQALECLVRLVSVRRSLFTNDSTRLKYLAHLMTGTKEIMETGKGKLEYAQLFSVPTMIIDFYVLLGAGVGLADHDNYHEFCRLLGRFKVNYQLSEIVNMEGYSSWISLVTEFTLKSLYSHGSGQAAVCTTFLGYMAGLSDDLSGDPLDNVELLQDQLECIPYLCRFQYESCSTFIMQITDPILQMYMEAVNLPALADNSELVIIEAKLAWVVHIIAAILKTRQLVGLRMQKLSARVLRLINVIDSGLHSQRYGEATKQRLDRAVLIFFQHFRKSYIGDQAMHSSKQLYARLSELLGLHDHLLILNVIVGKIATNLKCYAESEEVINHTLSLFSEMATGFMTGKLLLKLDTVQYIISHHNVFLSLESTPDAIFRTDTVKYALIGLMRDLRGIAMATNSRRTYGFLFLIGCIRHTCHFF
ncbi:ARM repeat superfamily protein [Actinidia rufa]|uniref:ARM repeat superfamily protein n=1 Tax=Actinidia rufa TaxID=165716 RepID=A0A7J0FI47_9ERIC|nr:ARM repeat superfamily protein [Actinidia rufa]